RYADRAGEAPGGTGGGAAGDLPARRLHEPDGERDPRPASPRAGKWPARSPVGCSYVAAHRAADALWPHGVAAVVRALRGLPDAGQRVGATLALCLGVRATGAAGDVREHPVWHTLP